jgi:hypothetical protein
MTAARSQAQAVRDMRLFRLGVRITDLRPEIAERWLLPGEHLPEAAPAASEPEPEAGS